jgi:hypothetical protein
MVENILAACPGHVSYVPTNPQGRLHNAEVASCLDMPDETKNVVHEGTFLSDSHFRVRVAIDIGLYATSSRRFLNLMHCASGIDRTGTVGEGTKQLFAREIYAKWQKDTKNIENIRALSASSAEIASHLIPGSPGMKPQSRVNLFSPETESALYLSSATHNKRNKVKDVSFLIKSSKELQGEFETKRTQLFTLKKLDKISEKTIHIYGHEFRRLGTEEKKEKSVNNEHLCLLLDAYLSMIAYLNKENLDDETPRRITILSDRLKKVDELKQLTNALKDLAKPYMPIRLYKDSKTLEIGWGLLFVAAALASTSPICIWVAGPAILSSLVIYILAGIAGLASVSALGFFGKSYSESSSLINHEPPKALKIE